MLLAARADAPVPAALTDTIAVRSEGNPFFAEELLAAAGGTDALPRNLRELLLQRVARLDAPTQSLLRMAATAGRDVGYPLLCAVAARPEREVRDSLRRAVEHGVLVSDLAAGSFRFRHALLAEAVYGTILPGEREEMHARLAEELARSDAATPAELAPHWAAAGRSTEALTASIEAARQAEAIFGLAEARAHLERAIALWDRVPDAPELAGLDLVGLCTWAAELAGETGAAARAVELAQRAMSSSARTIRIERSLQVLLGEYLHETRQQQGSTRCVRARRARTGRAAVAGASYGWAPRGRVDGGQAARRVAADRRGGARARSIWLGAREAEIRALTVLGGDLAYLGRAEGIAYFRQALELAEEAGGIDLERTYVNFSDALTMLGGPGRRRASATPGSWRCAARIDSSLLVSNQTEALTAIGEWDEADRLSAGALRRLTSSFPRVVLMVPAPPSRSAAASSTPPERTSTLQRPRSPGIACRACSTPTSQASRSASAAGRMLQRPRTRVLPVHGGPEAPTFVCRYARWACARRRSRQRLPALAGTPTRSATESPTRGSSWPPRGAPQSKSLRSLPPPADGARSRRPNTRGSAGKPVRDAGRTRRRRGIDSTVRTPRPIVADAWRRRSSAPAPLVPRRAPRSRGACGRGSSPSQAVGRRARAARRTGAALLESPEAESAGDAQDLDKVLGLTAREAEVLKLVARGYTNREIAEVIVISVKTAGVHVSHILRKLDASNRLEAAAIAHRVSP